MPQKPLALVHWVQHILCGLVNDLCRTWCTFGRNSAALEGNAHETQSITSDEALADESAIRTIILTECNKAGSAHVVLTSPTSYASEKRNINKFQLTGRLYLTYTNVMVDV